MINHEKDEKKNYWDKFILSRYLFVRTAEGKGIILIFYVSESNWEEKVIKNGQMNDPLWDFNDEVY